MNITPLYHFLCFPVFLERSLNTDKIARSTSEFVTLLYEMQVFLYTYHSFCKMSSSQQALTEPLLTLMNTGVIDSS